MKNSLEIYKIGPSVGKQVFCRGERPQFLLEAMQNGTLIKNFRTMQEIIIPHGEWFVIGRRHESNGLYHIYLRSRQESERPYVFMNPSVYTEIIKFFVAPTKEEIYLLEFGLI